MSGEGGAASTADYRRHGFARLDGLALAELIRRREVGAGEVLDATLVRIAAVNPRINAVSALAEARARADLVRLPAAASFAGVPILMKDLGAAARGLTMTAGSRYLARHARPAAADDELTARLVAAGFVIVGQTTVPEFGLNLTTEPALTGPTRNPWNPAHTAGGSSGGAAAAVAAGLVPIAHATDAAGSTRVPAACCGLVGLKASRGAVPQGPGFANVVFGLAGEHVVSRTVRDTAAVLDATAGATRGPQACPVAPGRLLAELDRPPAPLRIALVTAVPDGRPLARPCAAAAEAAAAALADLGHRVEPIEPAALEAPVRAAERVVDLVFPATVALALDMAERAFGAPPGPDELEPITRAVRRRGQGLSAADMMAAERALYAAAHAMAGFFETHDVLLTPALAEPPPRLGRFPSDHEDVDAHIRRMAEFAPFAALFNVTGQPAIVLPQGLTEGGLPLSVQLAGPIGADGLLLCLAAQLERARPFAAWPPALGAGAA